MRLHALRPACLVRFGAETNMESYTVGDLFVVANRKTPHTGFIPCHCVRCVCVSPRVMSRFDTLCFGCSSINCACCRRSSDKLYSARYFICTPTKKGDSFTVTVTITVIIDNPLFSSHTSHTPRTRIYIPVVVSVCPGLV